MLVNYGVILTINFAQKKGNLATALCDVEGGMYYGRRLYCDGVIPYTCLNTRVKLEFSS